MEDLKQRISAALDEIHRTTSYSHEQLEDAMAELCGRRPVASTAGAWGVVSGAVATAPCVDPSELGTGLRIGGREIDVSMIAAVAWLDENRVELARTTEPECRGDFLVQPPMQREGAVTRLRIEWKDGAANEWPVRA